MRASPWTEVATSTGNRCGGRRWTPSASSARRRSARERVHRSHGRADRRPRRPRHGVRDRRRRVLPSGSDRGLRAARAPVDRLAARRRAGRGQRGQALTDRLRAVEEGEAGRAVVAVAVGRRPSRLAHRVRGDVARPARRRLRHPRRRPGPRVPASRERAGAGGRRGHTSSRGTGCTTAGSWSRARRCRSRSATSPICSTSSQSRDPRAYRLLVLRSHYRAPIEVTKETVADAEQGTRSGSTRSPAASPMRRGRAEPDADALARVPRVDGRRPRHARRDRACSSISSRGPTRTTTWPPRPRRSRSATRSGSSCTARSGEIGDDALGDRPPTRRGPRREGLGRRRRAARRAQRDGLRGRGRPRRHRAPHPRSMLDVRQTSWRLDGRRSHGMG